MRMFAGTMLGSRGKSIPLEQEDADLEEEVEQRPWYRRLICFRRSSEEHSGASYFLAASSDCPHHPINDHQFVIDTSFGAQRFSRRRRANPENNSRLFYRMAVKAAKARKKLKMDDPGAVVDRVDTVSKFMFPSLYFLFNVLYWIGYLYWIPDEIDNYI